MFSQPMPHRAASFPRHRLSRRHVIMLALAVEILIVGTVHADRYRRPGITVDMPLTRGHVIT